MDTLSYKTKSISNEAVQHKWFIVDAENLIVGRLATKIASVLKGKHKVSYTPHIDNGDYVIVINADKVRFTGNKMTQKGYQRYSGYPGGLKEQKAEDLMSKHPERIIEKAVKGMLPKNRLGRQLYRKLFVYAGSEHPHEAQKPEKLEL